MTKYRLVPCLLAASTATLALAQGPTISAVTNGVSFTDQISPGIPASIFGSDLSGHHLKVTVDRLDCPVLFTSTSQLNIQIPWEAKLGPGKFIVEHDGLSSAPFSVTLSKYSPALFVSNNSGTGLFYSGAIQITSANPANGGDTLTTFAVGLGQTNPPAVTGVNTPNPPPYYVTLAAPSISVGKRPADILFSGLLPAALAIDQLNLTLAPNTPVGTQTVLLRVGSASTNLVTVPIGCQDFTSAVSVTTGPLQNPSPGQYTQTVTIQNTSGKRIAAKASLLLTKLTSSAQLTNGGGKSCPSSDLSLYKSFTFTGSGASQTATVTLDFTDSSTGSITYGQRILAQ